MTGSYMNPELGHGRRALARRALAGWLAPRLEQEAATDPALGPALHTLASLDLTLTSADAIEAAEKWAGDCARLLRRPEDRTLASHVSLAANGLLRSDDDTLVREAAHALACARGGMGFLLVRDVCDAVHELGFTDRVS